ncbi:MAG: hypothetical protein JWN79_3118 [Gemmatimonadetes bacterium]|nr:hypothetical protein [Gemmatimonadota bacterium]
MHLLQHHTGRSLRRAGLLALVAAGTMAPPRLVAQGRGAEGHQYIVGVDVSSSVTDPQREDQQRALAGLVKRMQPGDRIVIVETYRQGTLAARQWIDSIPRPRHEGPPSSRDRQNVQVFQVVAGRMASSFLKPPAQSIMSTDLLRTISRAADYAKSGAGRRTTLVLLSDMLQSTREVNMESGAIPGDAWIQARRREGRLPDLRNVCVFVIGGDPTSRTGARVRRFWEHYFVAAGATFPPENYRNMVADADEIGCSR